MKILEPEPPLQDPPFYRFSQSFLRSSTREYMRPVFRNRFIALSICLCALLAFSTTLSADTYTFVPGVGVSGLSYLGVSGIGPYGGTLTDTTTSKVSPDSIF